MLPFILPKLPLIQINQVSEGDKSKQQSDDSALTAMVDSV